MFEHVTNICNYFHILWCMKKERFMPVFSRLNSTCNVCICTSKTNSKSMFSLQCRQMLYWLLTKGWQESLWNSTSSKIMITQELASFPEYQTISGTHSVIYNHFWGTSRCLRQSTKEVTLLHTWTSARWCPTRAALWMKISPNSTILKRAYGQRFWESWTILHKHICL